jgi:hypothetical protein
MPERKGKTSEFTAETYARAVVSEAGNWEKKCREIAGRVSGNEQASGMLCTALDPVYKAYCAILKSGRKTDMKKVRAQISAVLKKDEKLRTNPLIAGVRRRMRRSGKSLSGALARMMERYAGKTIHNGFIHARNRSGRPVVRRALPHEEDWNSYLKHGLTGLARREAFSERAWEDFVLPFDPEADKAGTVGYGAYALMAVLQRETKGMRPFDRLFEEKHRRTLGNPDLLFATIENIDSRYAERIDKAARYVPEKGDLIIVQHKRNRFHAFMYVETKNGVDLYAGFEPEMAGRPLPVPLKNRRGFRVVRTARFLRDLQNGKIREIRALEESERRRRQEKQAQGNVEELIRKEQTRKDLNERRIRQNFSNRKNRRAVAKAAEKSKKTLTEKDIRRMKIKIAAKSR